MQATTPPAEAELFAKNIMSTYGRYPITMVKYAEFYGYWTVEWDAMVGLGWGRGGVRGDGMG